MLIAMAAHLQSIRAIFLVALLLAHALATSGLPGGDGALHPEHRRQKSIVRRAALPLHHASSLETVPDADVGMLEGVWTPVGSLSKSLSLCHHNQVPESFEVSAAKAWDLNIKLGRIYGCPPPSASHVCHFHGSEVLKCGDPSALVGIGLVCGAAAVRF